MPDLPDQPPVYLVASIGVPDLPGGRIQVDTCPTCSALVPTDYAGQHQAWHQRGGH